MSFRQDKLVVLLENGTSQQVRRTAGKQLVEICVKIFKAFEKEDEAWPEIFGTVSKLLALLRVKSSDSRHAAAYTLGLLASSLSTANTASTIPSSEAVDVAEVIQTGQNLLASAGREYVAKPVGDKAKRKKDMLGSLGLSDAVGWDVDNVIGDEEDVKEDLAAASTSNSTTPAATAAKSEPITPPVDIFEGLSARQVMMIKRKKGNMAEEANKMRRLNAAADSSSLPENGPIIIAPKEKTGAVEPHDIVQEPTVAYSPDQSPWVTAALDLVDGLQEPSWEVRHGSALGLLEIVRATTLPSPFLIFLSRRLLTLLTLDKFGDFVGDTVVAPVRETAAQALGITLKYLDVSGVSEVHQTLMSMVKQSWAQRGAKGWQRFSWEIRHAGLLGLKYEVAVRRDLLEVSLSNVQHLDVKSEMEVETKIEIGIKAEPEVQLDIDLKPDISMAEDLKSVPKSTLMTDVIDAAILALRDLDDDVRTVAATALMPIVSHLASLHDLSVLLDSLWGCLAEGGDELGSSTAAVMDLLGDLVLYERVINADPRPRLIFPFIRHAIASVRLAVVKSLLVFIKSSPSTEWMNGDFLSLLFQNLVLEERDDIREYSLVAFTAAIKVVDPGQKVVDWYAIAMTPIGNPLDPTLFVVGKIALHNVDKHMMACDMSLISMDTVLKNRIAAARGLSLLGDTSPLARYLESASAHQIFLAAVIVQESKIASLAPMLISFIEGPPPPTYHEMLMIMKRIHTECQALLTAFSSLGKIPKDRVPAIPSRIDPLSNAADVFSLDVAKSVVTTQFDNLVKALTKTASKIALSGLKDRQRKILGSIGYFSVMKERYDVQVSAAVAGALISLRIMPPKIGPVIRSVMDGVKREENEILQTRAAESVASFIEYCYSPSFTNKINPCDKVIKNLFTFLCSDVSVTPVFNQVTCGILSLDDATKVEKEETEEQIAARVTRRGALQALTSTSRIFGSKLFSTVPKFWEGISRALGAEEEANQDLIDCLTGLILLAPEIDPSLHHQLVDLYPNVIKSLESPYTVVRKVAARCLAALCNVVTEEGMRRVVDQVVPMVGDAKNVTSRQGAVEAIHHIIKLLDIKALPYVLFLIVPILGRMSDPDEAVRLLSTSTFASLIKMVPLEAGLPDPPGFSKELLLKRDEERQFLMQLLDGSKAEQYHIPIPIKADLRQYQKDGVSWLAFLAKYQLHGILCDDMGLGKSLQSICIIGSKHFERAERFKSTGSTDSAHLPSLIVCPPTLTGHWFHEIPKFTDYLRPFQYVGNSYQRAALRPQLQNYDVIITSYEVVRNDIAELGKIDWLYCVLDEGHIIKNAKTKLATAVKQIKAQHRLLLSGTPIQNNVLELWSLFDFLMPGFLGSDRAFNDRFSKPILADREGKATPKERELATSALEALHKQVLPFLLRRLKEDVLGDLPPKIIQDYHCELSDVQKQLYDEFQQSKAADEAGEAISSGQGQQHVFQSLQYLRKLCNHPALVLDGDPERVKSIMARLPKGTPPLHDICHAPKLEALKQLLNDCGIGLDKVESAHRVLIFCQLRPMLDIIEKDLFQAVMPSVTYMRMDGNTDPKKRHAVVQTFNGDPNIDVLLLTTSVGGLGLNLTGADTVIFVDHDWNPMKDLQAMDRAHRLGQKKVVNVYRLIMRGTLEDKIMGLQRFKLNIASSVVTQQNSSLGSMNTGEVLDLFKVAAEGEPTKTKKESTGPVSSSKVLEGLEDLPPEDEYAELSLENFLSKV